MVLTVSVEMGYYWEKTESGRRESEILSTKYEIRNYAAGRAGFGC